MTKPEIEIINFYKVVTGFRQRFKPPEMVYVGIEDFLEQHGQFWKVKSRPKQVPLGTIKMCFNNAFHQIVNDDRYYYAEGYAMGIIPVNHAWIVDREDNKAIELTWPEPGVAYHGVIFDSEYVIKHTLKREEAGVLACHRSPLLFEKSNKWKVKHDKINSK
jgi:hypothetical protein